MRLAFSAWAMGRQSSLERQIAIVREAGYGGIELVHQPHGVLDASRLDGGARAGIRRQLAEAGLTATAIAAHGDPLAADADAEMARVVAAIDLAGDLSIPYVVTMAYGRPEEYPVVRERVAQRFARLAEHGAGRNVVVCLEPHVGQAFDTAEKCLWLVNRVRSPSFRLNFDNSHFEVMGVDQDEYLPKLLPISAHTHLKDQRGRAPAHEFLVPGEGEFDYARYLRAMAAGGYAGWITVEVSVMVQRRPGYDAAWAAALAKETLTKAAAEARVRLD